MALFSKKAPAHEPNIRPTHTLGSQPQASAEEYGAWPRRMRLFHFFEVELQRHDLASKEAFGRPLGDGSGLEELTRFVGSVMAKERSLIRGVGLRGAIANLWQCGPEAWQQMSAAVGLSHEGEGPAAHWTFGEQGAELSRDRRDAALGLHASIMLKVANYDEIQTLSLDAVKSDHRWFLSSMTESHGLDYIAWAAIVICRLDSQGLLPPAVATPPMPSRLDSAGWFVDPMFAKCDRYWDGEDWTDRCRFLSNSRMKEVSTAL